MKFKILLLSIVLCLNVTLMAQDYFQQEVNYEIHVRLNDTAHSIHATMDIEYKNNSPDTLAFIYFHLWPNAYKNKHTALAKQLVENGEANIYFAEEENYGYIDSLNFSVNDQQAAVENHPEHIDICKLILNKPLLPGETIHISTPFYVKIPSSKFSRIGHNQQNYNLTQWYPKPAVYDLYGWHEMPYLDMGEFYSEFGSFDVYITVPDNYMVAATGNLMNEEELDWLEERYQHTLKMIENNWMPDSTPPSSKTYKTLHYQEKNIHDFAWFTGKQFHLLKGSVTLPNSGRVVNTWAFFTFREWKLWKNSIEYINDALYYYSKWLGDYPYNNCTAVFGALGAGGGMEYPTITVIGRSGNAILLEEVIMHEVGHNWFYGVLASNERQYPYLDEGINTYYEHRYMKTKYPEHKLHHLIGNEKVAKVFGLQDYENDALGYYGYLITARLNIDQPINDISKNYTAINYGTITYFKAALVLGYLEAYLGTELFDTIMQDYFETWKFKHPYPSDLEAIFKKHTDKNLDWFFKDVLNTTKKIDYKISRIQDNRVLVKNRGEIESPFSLHGLKNNESTYDLWQEGFSGEKWITLPDVSVDGLVIDQQNKMPDIRRQNNYAKTKGILKRTEPFKMQFAGIIENPAYTQLNYLPVFGYNYYDGFMPGLLLYNNFLPNNRFEFQLLPFFSIKQTMLNGNANVRYNSNHFKKIFQNESFSINSMRYGSANMNNDFIYRISLNAQFDIRKKQLRNPYYQRITLNANTVPSTIFYNLKYSLYRKTELNPVQFNTQVQFNEQFVKSWLELLLQFNYKKNKNFDIRVFAGKFLQKDETIYGDYRFRLSGWNGSQDYQFEHIFLGRYEGINDNNRFFANQFVDADGGFGIYTPLGQTDNWLISLNTKADLPINAPLKVYFNLATFNKAADNLNNGWLFYETGLQVSIGMGALKVFFPVSYSNRISEVADLNNHFDNYFQKIRFALDLNKINPFTLPRKGIYF